MWILRWMYRQIIRSTIRNENIFVKIGVALVEEMRLRWFRHVRRRCEDVPVRRCERLHVEGLRNGTGRPNKSIEMK